MLYKGEVKLVLIHEAFGELTKKINSDQKVILETILLDKNQKAKTIKFELNSVYETLKSENFNYRKPFVKHRAKQRIASKFVRQSEKVNTIKDCYLLCRQRNCKHFNVCKGELPGSNYDCELAADDERALDELVADDHCNVFEANDLNLFDKHEESRFENDPLEDLPSISLEDCARRCLNRADDRCKSIVFFEDGSKRNCQLSDQHMENQWNRVEQLKNFTIYSSEFVVAFLG